jgi:hypothetical protein
VQVGNNVTRVKTAFKWMYDQDWVAPQAKFGSEFKRPKEKVVRVFRRGQKRRFSRLTKSDYSYLPLILKAIF